MEVGRRALQACFYRGGTSKGLVLAAAAAPAGLDDALTAAMGSPDAAFKRQLDGLGGGTSSTSKVMVVEPATGAHHASYSFAQVPVGGGAVDWRGNCGNLTAAVAMYAVDHGLVPPPQRGAEDGSAVVVRLLNSNTNKTVEATVGIGSDGLALVGGSFVNPGVAGSGSPIELDFLEPSGALTGRMLPGPGGEARHVLRARTADGVAEVEASLVDVTTATVIISEATAERLGFSLEDPAPPAVLERLEAVRRAGAELMGLDPDTPSVPKVGVVGAPAGDGHDVRARFLSMGQPHLALPLTAAMCLAAAARVSGSVAAEAAGPLDGAAEVRLAHPSGVIAVRAQVEGELCVRAGVTRTARCLMQGSVFY